MEEKIILTILRLDNMLERTGNRIATMLGATQPQWQVLSVLNDAGPNGVSLSDLGTALDVTKGNITGLIDRMERDGLARRKDDPNDRRVIRAIITPIGRRVLRDIGPVRKELWQKMFSDFSAKEKREFQDFLDRLVKRIGEFES